MMLARSISRGLRAFSSNVPHKQTYTGHFPVENFVDLRVRQGKKTINLYSYKHPAKQGPPKAVALLL